MVGALLACVPSLCRAESLLDAIQMAYESNPALRAQRADLRAVNEGYVQARSHYGPQINLSGGVQYQNADVQFPASLFSPAATKPYQATTATADLSLVQPIYTAGRLKAGVDEASDNILTGRETLRAVEARLILNVIIAYMDVLRDRKTVRVIQLEIADLTTVSAEATQRGRLGQISRTDVAQAESRLLAAKAQLVQAQGRLGVSSSEYLASVGQNPGELEAEPELAGVPNTVDEAFDAADKNNAELMAAIQKERAARERINQAKAANGPTVSIKVDAAITPYAPYIPNQYDRSFAVQAVITQPLYTSGFNSSKIREAVENASSAQLTIESTRRGVVQLVSQAWDQFTSSHNALLVTTQQVKTEEIALEGNRMEERAGLRTTIDLLNAEAELANTRLSAIQSHHDEYVARAALLSAMGMLEIKYLASAAQRDDPVAPLRRVENRTAPKWEDAIGRVLDQVAAPSTPPSPAETPPGRPRPVDHPIAAAGGQDIAPLAVSARDAPVATHQEALGRPAPTPSSQTP